MEAALRQRLANQLGRGEVVLFTGAGFSTAARSSSGLPVPSVEQLRQELWPLAFPGVALDQESELGEIYEVASSRAGGAVRNMCERLLTVDSGSLPECYRTWWSAPWSRVYTVNVDNLDEAAGRQFSLRRGVRSVSAFSDTPIRGSSGELLSIHLNGRVQDYPSMTFSPRQYGERTAVPDAWYQQLVADLASKPILFVGTSLDEPPLWHYLALRGSRERRTRELRPGSYLVTPQLSLGRQGILASLNITWIRMSQQEFAESVLSELGEAYQRGHDLLGHEAATRSRRPFYIVGSDDESTPADLAEFLMGREPTWRDLTQGFAVVRDFEEELFEQVESSQPNVLVVSGTAGAGKSTTIRALALRYRAVGKKVIWVDAETDAPLAQIRRDLAAASPDVVIIDDVDRFGRASAGMLADLAHDVPGALVVGAVRSTRFEQLHFASALGDVEFLNFVVPHLQDRDIVRLIDALARANRLGRLLGKSEAERRAAFRDSAGRQLIVAMLEATSGIRFEDKLDRECEELGLELGLVYAIVAAATSQRHYVTRDEILVALGDATNASLTLIERLISQRLLVVSRGTEITVRHRIVSDRALDYYKRNGQLGEALKGLMFAIAAKVDRGASRKSREWRFLIRLINHDLLKSLTSDVDIVRDAYEEIENLLAWDYQYWLQRGSFEVEVGDPHLAQNFLDQARALAPSDAKVQTEWSYMMLKRAYLDPENHQSAEWAAEAFAELAEAIEARGRIDSYPYHVMGSQGLAWARRARMSDESRIELLSELRSVLREAKVRYPGQRDIDQLAYDVEHEYLMMSVPPEQRGGVQP